MDASTGLADHRLRVLIEETLAEADRAVLDPPPWDVHCGGDAAVDLAHAETLARYSAALLTCGLLRRLLRGAGIPVDDGASESELRMLWGDR